MSEAEIPQPNRALPPPLPPGLERPGDEHRPLELAVRSSVPYGRKTDVFAGKGRILVTPLTLCVQVETDPRVREITGKNEIYELKIAWANVRELKSLLAERGVFSANVGEGTADFVLQFRILSGDVEALAGILGALPEEVRLDKCRKCGAGVRGTVCPTCGADRKTVSRREGVGFLGAGVLMIAIGLIFAMDSSLFSAGRVSQVQIWLVVIGCLLALRGLIQFFAGANIRSSSRTGKS